MPRLSRVTWQHQTDQTILGACIREGQVRSMNYESLVVTIFGALFGVIIGGVITVVVGKYYYERASIDLQRESTELRHYVRVVLRALEGAGVARITWDKTSGRPIDVELHIRVSSVPSGEALGTPTLTMSLPEKPPEPTKGN